MDDDTKCEWFLSFKDSMQTKNIYLLQAIGVTETLWLDYEQEL